LKAARRDGRSEEKRLIVVVAPGIYNWVSPLAQRRVHFALCRKLEIGDGLLSGIGMQWGRFV
jgi:hypothetical protein